MMLFVYIHGLTGRVFKILPLREEMEEGRETHLEEYVSSLARDAFGALTTFPELQEMSDYITVVNILQYFDTAGVELPACKQEVFKMLKILNRIEKRLQEGGGVSV